MKLKGFLTERKSKPWRSFQLVYEWEDLLSSQMQLSIFNSNFFPHFLIRNINRLKIGWFLRLIDSLRPIKNYYLYFDMEATSYFRLPCLKNIIPIYIDFWLLESELEKFYKIHSNSKLVLFTSKEVCDVLRKNGCPFPIGHFPLSLPDLYISANLTQQERPIDFLFAGRRDPDFFEYVKLYERYNPDIEYVYQELENDTAFYVSNKRGKLSGNYNSRESYNQLLRSSRISFYTTPGIDKAKNGANGYNQVTPRFLELLSNGCLVLASYKDNPDVNFYDLENICFKVDSYDDFKKHMTLFSDNSFVRNHISNYYSYLCSHSTSSRVKCLQSILKKNNLIYK